MSAVWPAVYARMTASVIQVVSPEFRTISRRTSWRSFDSSSANLTRPPPNLNAFFMPGVAALSAGPPSMESSPRTRSGRATARRKAMAAPLLWATTSAPVTPRLSSTRLTLAVWAANE